VTIWVTAICVPPMTMMSPGPSWIRAIRVPPTMTPLLELSSMTSTRSDTRTRA